jgi:hypothetical protein
MRFSSTIVSAALLTLANAASLSGQATFYGGNVAGGACSFSTYTLPSDIFGTALSDSNWNNSVNCGACVSVTGPSGNSILAMVKPILLSFQHSLTLIYRLWMSVLAAG